MSSTIAVIPSEAVEQWLQDFKATAQRLIESERELIALKEDKLVTWEWVCWYFDIDKKTARLMLMEENIVAYGRKVKRFKKSDIIRFAERHSLKVKNSMEAPPAREFRAKKLQS
jgi:hypothetical protein